jgi:hypothetical protein
LYTVSLRIGHSQERLWHTAQWQGGQHTSIASGPVLLPSAPAAARGVLHLASAGRAARPRAARPRAARSCVATLAPLPMRSRSTPQHTHVLVLHASRPRLVGSCAAQAEGRHTLRGRQREKRAIARNAGKQVRSVAPSQQVERRSLQGEARRERTVFTRRSIQRLVALLLRLVFSWSRGISFLRPISCGMRARSWRRSRRLRQRACAGRVWTRYARTVAGSGVGTPIRGRGTAGTARL